MHTLYYPLTAHPFDRSAQYTEIAPCQALAPYIRCFWGTLYPLPDVREKQLSIVTPDTCMDVIFTADYTANTLSCSFCGINDHTFPSHIAGSGHLISTFAIRFYPWAAALFATDALSGTENQFLPAEAWFAPVTRALAPHLFDFHTLSELSVLAENALLAAMHTPGDVCLLHSAMHRMIRTKGALPIASLARNEQISPRRLERIFHRYVGMTPKKIATLIRYQQVLRDAVLYPDFDIQDAVLKYGYTDQSHLLHEFCRFHTMTPREARAYALSQFYNTDR